MRRLELTKRLSQPGIHLRSLSWTGRIALAYLVVIVLVAVFAPLLAYRSPFTTGVPNIAPSAEHWLGSDSAGRDIFARLVYGSRWSLLVGFGSTLLALVAGGLLGALAATASKRADSLLMRCLDVIMSFPGIVLAAVIVTVFGKGLVVLICAIAFLYMPSLARVVRANVLSQYSEDYVKAEQVLGAPRWYIVRRHVIRNCAAPILVYSTVVLAEAIVFEAGLSFIGLGVQEPNPSWGSVIADGKALLLAGGWWATFFPGLLIMLTVLALNVIAEGMSDAWAAPSGHGGRDTAVDVPDPLVRGGAEVPLEGLVEAGRRLSGLARPVPTGEPLLEVRDLSIKFAGRHNGVDVVDRVSFDIRPGEVLGLVGESGCGKSLTSLAIMGLEPRGAQLSGQILFDGQDLLSMSARARSKLMGHEIAMIYQDALSSLNPALTISAQLRQLTRRGGTRTEQELLELVGLDPGRTLRSYPHELSGGQRQRVLIAMALSRNPRLIVADEPTTALDVTVQAQVMRLLLRLREEVGFSLLLVSHDLALIADVCDQVVVMYGGQVAEAGQTPSVVGSPRHHYARGLLRSVLSLESADARLSQIPGTVPSPASFPQGCRFADRCPAATQVCHDERPALEGDAILHQFACHHPTPVLATDLAAPTPGPAR